MDTSILSFFLLAVVNVTLIIFVIYRWGMFSAEGYAMALLLLLVVSDAGTLYWCYLFNPDALPLGMGEFAFRIYPTIIHIIGISAFICGLYVSNRNPVPVIRPITRNTQRHLKMIALTITLIGLTMYLIAIYLVGGFGAADFYSNLNQYRTDDLAYGGFWYRGADIMLLGLSMLLMTIRRGWMVRSIILLLIGVAPLVLESNKGGLEKSVIYLAFCSYVFRPKLFHRFCRPSLMVPVLAVLLVTLGLKNVMTRLVVANKSGTVSMTDYNLSDLSYVVSQSIGGRFSYVGIYRGYCKMANYLHNGYAPLFGGKVLLYTFDSWIPRMVWPNKPEHPFHGTGYMISVSGENSEKEASAPSFVGYSLADYGPWGVVTDSFCWRHSPGASEKIHHGQAQKCSMVPVLCFLCDLWWSFARGRSSWDTFFDFPCPHSLVTFVRNCGFFDQATSKSLPFAPTRGFFATDAATDKAVGSRGLNYRWVPLSFLL